MPAPAIGQFSESVKDFAARINSGEIKGGDELALDKGKFVARGTLLKTGRFGGRKVRQPSCDIKSYLKAVQGHMEQLGKTIANPINFERKITAVEVLTLLSQYEREMSEQELEPIKPDDPVYATVNKPRAKMQRSDSSDSVSSQGSVNSQSSQDSGIADVGPLTAEQAWNECGNYFDGSWHPENMDGWLDILEGMDIMELRKLAFTKFGSKAGFNDRNMARASCISVYAERKMDERLSMQPLDATVKDLATKAEYAPDRLLGKESRRLFTGAVKADSCKQLRDCYLKNKECKNLEGWRSCLELLTPAAVLKDLVYVGLKDFTITEPARKVATEMYALRRFEELFDEGELAKVQDQLKNTMYKQGTVLGDAFRVLVNAVKQSALQYEDDNVYENQGMPIYFEVLGLDMSKKYTGGFVQERFVEMLHKANGDQQKENVIKEAYAFFSENRPEWWGEDPVVRSKPNPKDLETLGFSASSTPSKEQVKKAYLKKSMLHHPDRHSSKPEEEQKAQAELFKEVVTAHERLLATY